LRGRVEGGADQERDREVGEAGIRRGGGDDPHLIAALQDVGQDRKHALIARVAEGESASRLAVDLDGKFGGSGGDLAAAGDAGFVISAKNAILARRIEEHGLGGRRAAGEEACHLADTRRIGARADGRSGVGAHQSRGRASRPRGAVQGRSARGSSSCAS
jgi:hypothetical protein